MIICAAIKVYLKSALTNMISKEPVIIAGIRHSDCYETLSNLKIPSNEYEHSMTIEGFINHKNEFLNRYQAYEEAVICGQLPTQIRWERGQVGKHELYSEDLY